MVLTKRLMGIKIDAKLISVSGSMQIQDLNKNIIGELRSGVYSPHFQKVIGIAMINKPYWVNSLECEISINENIHIGRLCELPFI